jgi:hypothetical protein
VDVKKYLLDKIVRLSFVPENSLTNISDWMSVTPKKERQRFAITNLNTDYQGLVGFAPFSWSNCVFVVVIRRGTQWCDRAVKPNCD